MAIKIYEKFAPRANPADGDYPYGSIKNESVPGAKDGTPLDAEWGNDYAGFDAALLAEAGIVPSGQPDKLGASQRVDAMSKIYGRQFDNVDAMLNFNGFNEGQSVRTLGYYTKGDGGAATYTISATGTVDGVLVLALPGGLKAVLDIGTDVEPANLGVRADGTDGVPANHEIMQVALNAGYKSFDFGGSHLSYLFNGIFGLPDQGFYQENVYYIKGNGAKIFVESPTALITSKTVADNGGIGTGGNTFAGKVYISGLTFLGTALNGVFDGDYLYNVYFINNHCYDLDVVTKSYQSKPGGYPNGYFQSVYIAANHFVSCKKIMDGKRGFNINFTMNMCEACLGGLYIDGNGQPALNNIRIRDNVFEGGGLFGSFGDAIGGIIEGNYLEANTIGDTLTKKCHIDLSYKGGSQYYDWRISRNSAQDTADQVSDTNFQMVSFDGASQTAEFKSVLLEGNWTSSRVTNFISIKNTVANRQGARHSKFNMPETAHENRIDYINNFQSRTIASNLVGSKLKVVTIDIPDGNVQERDLTLTLNVLMKGQTSGGITTCCAVADIKVLISASGSGVLTARLPTTHSVTAALMGYTQQPNGTLIDTAGPYNGTVLFTNPTISVERVGTKVHIILDTYAAAGVPNYGNVTKVATYITAQAFSYANNYNTAARWITFTQ